MGAKGAYVAASSEPPIRVASFEVVAIDTTAAGDCFHGAFAVGLMTGKTAAESARYAAAAAAVSVTRPGAQPSMPTSAEADRLLEGSAIMILRCSIRPRLDHFDLPNLKHDLPHRIGEHMKHPSHEIGLYSLASDLSA